MVTREIERAARRASVRARAGIREDVERLRLDAGWSIAQLARASGVDPGYLYRILNGDERPSIETYARLIAALGADLALRAYAGTGPAVRDRHQAPMLELLLAERHPRWTPYTEVLVRRPARGSIDAVLHEPRERVAVAAELQGELRRLEQLVRWQTMKAESLPSWGRWSGLAADAPTISRLLLVRRTRATRQVASEFARQLRVAYPAHPDDAVAAITGTAAWPGPALVWASLDGAAPRFLQGR